MPMIDVNGVRLYHTLHGEGDTPLVLVHGSWTSHATWLPMLPSLEPDFHVLAFDRRGHSASDRPPGQGCVREDVADLAALIEAMEIRPAWILGNSFGASISLRLAGERPELIRGLVLHEPPLFSLLADDPVTRPLLAEIDRGIGMVTALIAEGRHAEAAERFVDDVALGPGSWALTPLEMREMLIDNAPTFLDEARDPEQLAIDLEAIGRFRGPVLFTLGEHSPPTFAPVVEKLVAAVPHAEVATIPDAGHIPQATHPEDYGLAVQAFIKAHQS